MTYKMSNIYIFSSYICRNVTSPNRRESSQEPPRTTFDETLSGLVKRGETLLSPYPSTVFLQLRWGTVASSALRLELNRVRKGLLKNGKIYNVRCRPAGSRPRAGRSPPTIHRGQPKKKWQRRALPNTAGSACVLHSVRHPRTSLISRGQNHETL